MSDGVVARASLLRGSPRSGALEEVAGQLRPIVMVLGVRHSGASLSWHVRVALGVDTANRAARELADREPDDVTGASERRELPDLHERILGFVDCGCDTPLHGFDFPIAWRAVPRHLGCCQPGIRFSASVMART